MAQIMFEDFEFYRLLHYMDSKEEPMVTSYRSQTLTEQAHDWGSCISQHILLGVEVEYDVYSNGFKIKLTGRFPNRNEANKQMLHILDTLNDSLCH